MWRNSAIDTNRITRNFQRDGWAVTKFHQTPGKFEENYQRFYEAKFDAVERLVLFATNGHGLIAKIMSLQ